MRSSTTAMVGGQDVVMAKILQCNIAPHLFQHIFNRHYLLIVIGV